MVFCRECKQQVEDCPHFVPPLEVRPVAVFDPKVRSLAYRKEDRILEIAFKNGQTWQLFDVPPDIYETLLQQTLSSFLKFIAHRYKARPVRRAADVPEAEPCPACRRPMTQSHKTLSTSPVRILWHCAACNQSLWRTYRSVSIRERRSKWH